MSFNISLDYGFYDISRTANLHNNNEQTQCFSIPKGKAEPLSFNGKIIGDINNGNNVNCEVISICPHGNVTHTECIGHITPEKSYVPIIEPLMKAILITIETKLISECKDSYPAKHNKNDEVICKEELENILKHKDLCDIKALIIRTSRGSFDKYSNFSGDNCPYFTPLAMEYLVNNNIFHLLIDLPSVDREDDQGFLASHSIFFGLPIRTFNNNKCTAVSDSCADDKRKNSTITELCFINNSISDGYYILNLQTSPFLLDAIPSRPILFPLK